MEPEDLGAVPLMLQAQLLANLLAVIPSGDGNDGHPCYPGFNRDRKNHVANDGKWMFSETDGPKKWIQTIGLDQNWSIIIQQKSPSIFWTEKTSTTPQKIHQKSLSCMMKCIVDAFVAPLAIVPAPIF